MPVWQCPGGVFCTDFWRKFWFVLPTLAQPPYHRNASHDLLVPQAPQAHPSGLGALLPGTTAQEVGPIHKAWHLGSAQKGLAEPWTIQTVVEAREGW